MTAIESVPLALDERNWGKARAMVHYHSGFLLAARTWKTIEVFPAELRFQDGQAITPQQALHFPFQHADRPMSSIFSITRDVHRVVHLLHQ